MIQDVETASKEVELAARRERTLKGVDCVRGILGSAVTVDTLMAKRDDASELRSTRLMAKRAIRFLADIARESSQLVPVIRDEDDLYASAEAVLMYGATVSRYVDLIKEQSMTPTEATGIFALREAVQDNFGSAPAINSITTVLGRMGVDPRTVHVDVDEVLADIEEHGFFDGKYTWMYAHMPERGLVRDDPADLLSSSDELLYVLRRPFSNDPQ